MARSTAAALQIKRKMTKSPERKDENSHDSMARDVLQLSTSCGSDPIGKRLEYMG